ncbi:MAG TPA: CehA/McbA family metallohydrolase [Anaerolineae bacterium]|nr:CehA/McbA family metallohydrolase [Anaerolineae bacterium]HMR65838.1 CehA/McbA family metallohydrolase [Anaerolineae bacterium]
MSQTWPLSKVFNPQPGWYCGELHTHSCHSDGLHGPLKLTDFARKEGLDFLAITDHNRIDAFDRLDPTLDFLIIPGIEITLQNGHFNIYGVAEWYDWMENICIGLNTIKLSGHYPTTTDLMRRTAGLGLLNSINHPFRDPFHWQDMATDLRYVHCLEIWNKPDAPDPIGSNLRAIALWTKLLNAGYRITAIGGSDHHALQPRAGEKLPTERVGWPRNYIYAEQLSVIGLLTGLRQHRVVVSMGAQVTFQARYQGECYGIGVELGRVEGAVELNAEVMASPVPARAQIVKNGDVVTETRVVGGEAGLGFEEVLSPDQPAWYRLDVYDEAGLMLAVSNPIFAGPQPEPLAHAFGDFVW